jgi:hypothetical protein
MKFMKSSAMIFLGCIVLSNAIMAESIKLKFDLDVAALEERGQLKQLRYFKNHDAIELNDIFLVEDDAPAIGKPEGAKDRSWFEKLHKGVMIRKDLILDDPRAFSGFLVFNGVEAKDNDSSLNIKINGIHFLRPPTKYAHPFAKQYYTREWGRDFDNWFFVKIPVGALKKGTNEIILWVESRTTSWEIMIAGEEEYKRGSLTRIHHPNQSAKSRDRGKTWDFEKLGWKDELDGEYTIRLSLDRYVPQGEYVSPVIDLAEEWSKIGIKKRVKLKTSRLHWAIDKPEGTTVEITVRQGEKPVPASKSWSPYKKVEGLIQEWINPKGRYVQFKVILKTQNPLVTPSLKGLSIESTLEKIPAASENAIRIVEFRNGKTIRPSIEFVHEDFLKLKDLRKRFELDRVVTGVQTEFEAQLKLLRWAYEIPIKGLNPYAWNYYDLPLLKKDPDGQILLQKDYQGRRRDKHCLECNLSFIAACLAMGYPARWVNISTRSTYGHEVAEVWSNDFNKWVFMDATRDYYIFDPDTGIPMSLVEINERLTKIMPRKANWEFPIRWQIPDDSSAYKVRVAYREGNNKFSIRDVEQGPHLLLFKGQLYTPTRNDFASRPWPVPWRLSSNWGGDLFYGFYNEIFPRKREYRFHTDRRQDFNWPLNQSELTLSEAERPGVLQVDVDTETPCFETFLICFDNGEWRENPAFSFEWTLHEGPNRLRVRVRNSAGVLGPESSVLVVVNNSRAFPSEKNEE